MTHQSDGNHPENLMLLGWSPEMESEVTSVEKGLYEIGRISAVHRTQLNIAFSPGSPITHSDPNFVEEPFSIALFASICDSFGPATVGDWVLVDRATNRPHRILNRKTTLTRKAPGKESKIQLIAANVDTLFIVSSCNHDFNLSRIERFLAIAKESGCQPIIILTKADLSDNEQQFAREILHLDSSLVVETLDARVRKQTDVLNYWCKEGKTIALLGSSGVGKTTLANSLICSLSNNQPLPTNEIREDDSKGRHTTTSRSLHRLRSGGILIDNPGIRELQLADCQQAVEEVFDDVLPFLDQCQFRNCNHQTDIGCAAIQAIDDGLLDRRRLKNYLKLIAEQQRNSESLAERHRRDKKLGKMYKTVQSHNRKNKSLEN